MDTSASAYQTALKGAIALAKDPSTHSDAKTHFDELYQELSSNNVQAADLLKLLWEEYIAAQRISAFWQEISNAEKSLAEHMGESNMQLQRSYMRLVQEQ